MAWYDFDSEQYRSPIRKNTLKVQGVRGELIDDCVYYLDENNEGQTGRIITDSHGLIQEILILILRRFVKLRKFHLIIRLYMSRNLDCVVCQKMKQQSQ